MSTDISTSGKLASTLYSFLEQVADVNLVNDMMK